MNRADWCCASVRAPPTKVGCSSVRMTAFVADFLKVNVSTAAVRALVDLNGLFCLFAIMAFTTGGKSADNCSDFYQRNR